MVGRRAFRTLNGLPNQRIIQFSHPFSENEFSDGTSDEQGRFTTPLELGNIIGLEVFQGKLLVITVNGLITVDGAFDQSEFRIETFARSYSPIIPETVRVLGETIFFATDNGMCSVGANGRTSLLDVTDFSTQGIQFATVVGNQYLLSYASGRLLTIEKFFESYYYLSHGMTQHVWETDSFSLGYAAGRQFLKQIRLRTSGDLVIIARTENREQRIQVRANNRTQRININLKGEAFSLRLETNNPSINVTDLVAVIGFGR